MHSDSYEKFVKGDFSSLANSFKAAGFLVEQPLDGVLQICSTSNALSPRMRLFISVGVHGDETAPITMLASLLDELSREPQLLLVDLMVTLGNMSALAQHRRFIATDLNRLFLSHNKVKNEEAQRAEQLMQVAARFFAGHSTKWHLDLHSTIRASLYPNFAIVPGNAQAALLSWLEQAGMQAVVLSAQTSSATLSSFTVNQLGAMSCTVELGSIADALMQFPAMQHALAKLLRTGVVDQQHVDPVNSTVEPMAKSIYFRVVQEIIKRSDAFAFDFSDMIPNFTEFASATVLANDGAFIWSTGAQSEYVLFPNPNVQTGMRAGLMLVRQL